MYPKSSPLSPLRLFFSQVPLRESVAIIFLLFLSIFLYVRCLSYDDIHVFLNNVVTVFTLALLSSVALSSSFILTVLSPRFLHFFHRIFPLSLIVVSLFIIWFWNQEDTGGEEHFEYGRYASRGFLLMLAVELILVFSFIGMWKLVRRCQPKTRRGCLIGTMLCLIVISLFFGYQFSQRKDEWNKGLFGDRYLPEGAHSYCHVDDNVFLGNRYLPKLFIQVLLFSFWCRYDPVFVDVDESDIRFTSLSLNSKCDADYWTIELFPRITLNTFSLEDFDAVNEGEFASESYPYTHLPRRMNEERKIVELSRSSNPSYRYDGTLYETSIVRCGKSNDYSHSNVVVSLKHLGSTLDRDLGTIDVETKPNFVVLFLDSESRKSFEFDFPRSISVMQEMKDRNEMDLFQFFQHYVFGINTSPQTRALYNGCSHARGGIPIWKHAMKKGYITAFLDNKPNEWGSLYNSGPSLADHTHLEPYADTMFTNPDDPFDGMRGTFGCARKCFYQTETPQMILDYVKRFQTVYSNDPHFIIATFEDAHEGSGESVRYVDPMLEEYLQWFRESGAMENTVLLIMGDHGNHVFMVELATRQINHERLNPASYFLFPKGFWKGGESDRRYQNMHVNQYRPFTVYDLHLTWGEILGVGEELEEQSKYWTEKNGFHMAGQHGVNLLNEAIPWDREPQHYPEALKGLIVCDGKKENSLFGE